MINEILNERLKRLNDDELMLKAIKTVFSERIEKEKPDIEVNDTNFLLGEKYRAYSQAKKLLESVLTEIESYQERKVGASGFNKGK